MAGPGIRYLNFARALTSVASVTLAAPEPPDAEGEFEVRSTLELRRLSGRELARSFEVIVAQSLSPSFALRASKAGVGLVLDLYARVRCPVLIINGTAAIYFSLSGRVLWSDALVMAIGASADGYGGAGLARALGQAFVRRAVVVIGIAMAVSLMWR